MTAIGEARKELQNGNIIIYPTDTVWGMGCDPFNQKAIDQLAWRPQIELDDLICEIWNEYKSRNHK